MFVRVHLDEGNPVFVIGDLFQLHDFVVVVDCLLVDVVGQEIHDVFVDVFYVENVGQL